jgi:hypothetical protein
MNSTHHLLPAIIKAGFQSASIMSLADLTTQIVVEDRAIIFPLPSANTDKSESAQTDSSISNSSPLLYYDPKRTLRWTTIGLTLHGPYFFTAFRQLDRLFGASTSLKVATTKTVVGQLFVFPPYLTALFVYMGFLEGMNNDEIRSKVYDRVPKAFVGGCIFWPFANMVNFSAVPVKWRVVYLAGVGGLWNGYLSYLNQQDADR